VNPARRFRRSIAGPADKVDFYAYRDQTVFARILGVSVRTLQEWEQGRRAPSGAARTLLLIAAKNPHALLSVA